MHLRVLTPDRCLDSDFKFRTLRLAAPSWAASSSLCIVTTLKTLTDQQLPSPHSSLSSDPAGCHTPRSQLPFRSISVDLGRQCSVSESDVYLGTHMGRRRDFRVG